MIKFKEVKSLKDYDSVSLSELLRNHFVECFPADKVAQLSKAIQVASYLHRTKTRRGARGSQIAPPYIEHPLRVAVRLYRDFGVIDPDVIIAAVLHDTVEDHALEFSDFEGVPVSNNETKAREIALDFIATNFGFNVAHMLHLLSNPVMEVKPSKEEKLASYHKHITLVADTSIMVLLIKLSDFVDNAGSLHHHYEYNDKKVVYFLDRYEPIVPIYRKAFSTEATYFNSAAALDRLEKVVKQFQRFRDGQE